MTSNALLKTTIVSFITIFLSTLFLVSFTFGSSYAFQVLFPSDSILDKDTRVSTIDIGELTIAEATKLLQEETEQWKNTNTVSFLYKDKISSTATSILFQYDISGSIQYAKVNKISPLFVTTNEVVIDELLTVLSKGDLTVKIDKELLINDLHTYARTLKNENLQVNIHDYILPEYQEEIATLSEVYLVNYNATEELELLAETLNGVQIEPRQLTSILSLFGDDVSKYSYEMSVIASGIYSTILATNFEVVERNISQSLPEYIEIGHEAYVSFPNKDLRFFNPNYIPYTLVIEVKETHMYVALRGYSFENRYEVGYKDQTTFNPKLVLQYSASVPKGERDVIQSGKLGYAVNVYRTTYDDFNKKINSELLSEDFYRPIHRIEVRSLISQEETQPGVIIVDPDTGYDIAEPGIGALPPSYSVDPNEEQQGSEIEQPMENHHGDQEQSMKGY